LAWSSTTPELAFTIKGGAGAAIFCTPGRAAADVVVTLARPTGELKLLIGSRPSARISRTEVTARHVMISRSFMIVAYWGANLTASIYTFELKLT